MAATQAETAATSGGVGPVPVTFELPVTGGETTIERLGIRPEERSVALVIMARALHGVATTTSASLAVTFTEIFGPVTLSTLPPVPHGDKTAVVLAPFSAAFWRDVLQVDASADLFATIVKQRGALLVAAGALHTDADTRAWLSGQPALVRDVVRLWPGAFAVLAPGLSVTREGIHVPGDPDAWTALAGGAAPARPADFLRRILARDNGHLARFFATLAGLDAATRDALLVPLAGETPARTLADLYDHARRGEPRWPPNAHPFQLSQSDLFSVLRGLTDLDPAAPSGQGGLWPALLTARIGSRRDAAALLTRPPDTPVFASTVRAVLQGHLRDRRDRITMVALARRIWNEQAPAVEQADAVYALGQYRSFRALLVTLDRMDIPTPATWAAMVDAARRADRGGGTEREQRLAIFQGAVACVERAWMAGSLSTERADHVLRALADAIVRTPSVAGATAGWLVETLMPALPPLERPDRYSGRTAYESRLIQALAGPPSTPGTRVEWEGLAYAVDIPAAEHERILRIRALIPTPGLDTALSNGSPADLAAALTALAYAPALGDPDGPVTLSPDVATRHDFGRSSGMASSSEIAWAPPQERSGTGAPWRVSGSLLGLDLALARIALRRLSLDEMPAIPTINLNDQLTLARTAVSMRPATLDDEVRDGMADAMGRGRARVAGAGTDLEQVDMLAAEVAMSRAQRQTLAWTLATSGTDTARLFSLRDLLWLGRGGLDPQALAPWGVLADTVDGRVRPRFDRPVAWDTLAGRPDTGGLATEVPDLTLRLVEETARLRLPAALIPSLLLYATQDYWHEVEARFADDWPAMARGAAMLGPNRIEDYVAAIGGDGPLRPQ